MEAADGFTPIIAIFYAVFHPTEGTKILHQVPKGSIGLNTEDSDSESTIFNFDTIKNYVIPKPQVSDRLISFKIGQYRVIGYPVNINNSIYARNSFSFNFCFVFPYDSNTSPYELCIRRTARMFRVLEEQSFMLSKLDKDYCFFKDGLRTNSKNLKPTQNLPGHFNLRKITLSSVESLIDQICQDLNNYSECCIPLDSANSVDIKLFPILPPPLNINAYQVPLSIVNLELLVDVNWDPTMLKILPHINGINLIKKILHLADADYGLTKQCIQHLMHYKCIEIVDIFQFSNIYAPTNNVGNFLKVNGLAAECQAYVVSERDLIRILATTNGTPSESATGSASMSLSSSHVNNQSTISASNGTQRPPKNGANSTTRKILNSSPPSSFGLSVSPLNKSFFPPNHSLINYGDSYILSVPKVATLFVLYRSLNQGQTLKEWLAQHWKLLQNMDIRRFINFGILHGLIYRVHSYPVLNKSIESNLNELNELVESLRTEKLNSGLTLSTLKEPKLMQVNEGNLKTEKRRTVSFTYNVDGVFRMASKIDDLPNTKQRNDSSDVENALDFDNNERVDVHIGKPLANKDTITNEKYEYYKLIKLLKAYQHFDSICTELEKLRKDVEKMLDRLGNYSVINS